MEILKLNETPVRTSRNFNINNIKLENINIPEKIEKFSNINIINNNSKVEIDSIIDNSNIVYGLNEFFSNQVEKDSNQKIRLNINSKINKETRIEYKFDKENNTLIDNIQIIANENTKSTIIIKYFMEEDLEIFHNGIINVIAKNGAELDIVIINLTTIKSNNFIAIQNTLKENSKINYCIIDLGGKNSITNYYSKLEGKLAINNVNTIYLGKENQLFDLNYIAELNGEKTNINIEVQGALKDNAKKHFKGTIDFKKGCKKAKGNENEACVLLSDTAKSIALPMLLCSEEDVEGNHSTSAGKISEKELFYIMSRGFSLKEAMKLMVKAKFNKILENIKNEEIKEQILIEIDNRLD